MYEDTGLSFREFIAREELPTSRMQAAVFQFLEGRKDTVMFGAQAVNAYIAEARFSEDIDLLSTNAAEIAEELRDYLARTFQMAVQILNVVKNKGFRLYQIRKPRNRHLVDIRAVDILPPARNIGGVLVVSPENLVAQKIQSYVARKGRPKSWTDRRDLAMLLVEFPQLQRNPEIVKNCLRESGASEQVLRACDEIMHEKVIPEDEDSGY